MIIEKISHLLKNTLQKKQFEKAGMKNSIKAGW
jgi:hypothetical protein